MKLDVFDFIDDVVDKVDSKRPDLEIISEEIKEYFQYIFKAETNLFAVTKRIKSNDSINEKILRQNYFLKYKTVDNVLKHISDIIGIRIQCRFIEDEKKLYNMLIDYFAIESNEYPGYYYNPKNENIILKLSDKQPQTQHNGFHIYRIDGTYLGGQSNFNFEVQIKSFVNVFWGDIEHEILYKNFSYMITEDFVREMLYSIKRSLEQVDAQLMAVHDYLYELEDKQDEINLQQLKRVLSKLIHDIFSVGFKESTGVLLDFRVSSDFITDYLFAKAGGQDEENITDYFTGQIKKLSELRSTDFVYGGYLTEAYSPLLKSKSAKMIGSGIDSIRNADLKWNLILTIIFKLSDKDKEEEFAIFVDFLVYKLTCTVEEALSEYRCQNELREIIKDELMDRLVSFICSHYDSDLFSNTNMEIIKDLIRQILDEKTEASKFIRDSDLDYDWFSEKLEEEADF